MAATDPAALLLHRATPLTYSSGEACPFVQLKQSITNLQRLENSKADIEKQLSHISNLIEDAKKTVREAYKHVSALAEPSLD